jgi:hypothetical protein
MPWPPALSAGARQWRASRVLTPLDSPGVDRGLAPVRPSEARPRSSAGRILPVPGRHVCHVDFATAGAVVRLRGVTENIRPREARWIAERRDGWRQARSRYRPVGSLSPLGWLTRTAGAVANAGLVVVPVSAAVPGDGPTPRGLQHPGGRAVVGPVLTRLLSRVWIAWRRKAGASGMEFRAPARDEPPCSAGSCFAERMENSWPRLSLLRRTSHAVTAWTRFRSAIRKQQ